MAAISSGGGCGHHRGHNKRVKYFYLLLLLKEEISTTKGKHLKTVEDKFKLIFFRVWWRMETA